jgi:hypothetical protein
LRKVEEGKGGMWSTPVVGTSRAPVKTPNCKGLTVLLSNNIISSALTSGPWFSSISPHDIIVPRPLSLRRKEEKILGQTCLISGLEKEVAIRNPQRIHMKNKIFVLSRHEIIRH